MLVVTTGLKVFVGKDNVALGLVLGILWGIGNGGGVFLIRTILADVYEYDELVTGERREGEFGVYIDFFGEKLPSIPGEVRGMTSSSMLATLVVPHRLACGPPITIARMIRRMRHRTRRAD
eukprot:COSAG01_NODE_912_length_12786_cov_11.125621_8_plen_121_part_00